MKELAFQCCCTDVIWGIKRNCGCRCFMMTSFFAMIELVRYFYTQYGLLSYLLLHLLRCGLLSSFKTGNAGKSCPRLTLKRIYIPVFFYHSCNIFSISLLHRYNLTVPLAFSLSFLQVVVKSNWVWSCRFCFNSPLNKGSIVKSGCWGISNKVAEHLYYEKRQLYLDQPLVCL